MRLVALSAACRLDLVESSTWQHFLRDQDPRVRRRGAELLARSDRAAELVDHLVGLLDDEPSVAEMAAFALGEVGITDRSVVTSLEKMVRDHDDALCREAAVAALGALHSGRETILAALTDKATVRRRAVIALAPFDGPDIESALRTALDDRDWQVRQAAEDLLEP